MKYDQPINQTNPIRLALLGDSRSGKTCFISKLAYGKFRDTYYPTNQISPVLFTYYCSQTAQKVLDETGNAHEMLDVDAVLSPVLYRAVSEEKRARSDDAVAKNDFYHTYRSHGTPNLTPVLVELIDTPAFKPSQIVPFLEASLHIKLGREILRNLADEPRKPVSTNPLLVASGASELNGNIHGYFFVYSSVPSYNPPPYNEVFGEHKESDQNAEDLPDETFALLRIMKQALNEAWQEYNTFKSRWEKGKEHDVFSIKNAMRNMWSQHNYADLEKLRAELRSEIKLMENPTDPADPNCPPPIWLVCTNVNSPLSSPKFVENGKRLARHWGCGFVGLDSEGDVDLGLALMVREVVERRRLRRK